MIETFDEPYRFADSRLRSASDDPEDKSLVESVLSGFVHRNDAAETNQEPLLIANHDGRTMGDAIADELESSTRFDMSVAFVSQSALQGLKQHFLDFRKGTRPHSGRIFTSTYNYFNSPKTFRELLNLHRHAGIDVFIWRPDAGHAMDQSIASYPYHPKGYIFQHEHPGGPLYCAYIGSSNLTDNALTTNREWNLRVSALRDGSLVSQMAREIDRQLRESDPLTEDWLRQYERDFSKYAPIRHPAPMPSHDSKPISPNAMQNEALQRLDGLRERGESQAVVISATGTGKTYLSALDALQCHPRRLLYLAHQEQILTNSMRVYRTVMGPRHRYGILSGANRRSDADYLFASVQTMSKPEVLATFDSDYFDYILIDEVHHAAASSYRRIIDHFTPRFMLGMTATPERTDGANIFTLFGNNIAYEIRLQQALEQNMLCPFHYYGVHEYIEENPEENGSTKPSTRSLRSMGDGSPLARWVERLTSPERIRYIIDMIQVYSQAGTPVHGIMFCSRRDEAKRLSELFNQQFNQQAERPYHTRAVTGDTPTAQREQAIDSLNTGDLDYIFTVDLFNEGIDIPVINQIVMLRPTQSSIIFTQQLGRGLRKTANKDCLVVIDFVGNYTNNYLIPLALYGNTGDRDVARKNMQRESMGITSISFDPIARNRILAALDTANLSEMKLLSEQYRQLRFQLARIPMLMDFSLTDPSLVSTLAMKSGDYLSFVRSRERSLSRRTGTKDAESGETASGSAMGTGTGTSYLHELQPTSDEHDSIMKMLTATQIRGARPHELLALSYLCGIPGGSESAALSYGRETPSTGNDGRSLTVDELCDMVKGFIPQADSSPRQSLSALRVLDYSYFTAPNRSRFGDTALICTHDGVRWAMSERFVRLLDDNQTFARFLADTVRAGLSNCKARYRETEHKHLTVERGFVYGEKYDIFEVMRLCGWKQEQIAQNVGGYRLDEETDSLPIFIKYETSQYGDRFLSSQELQWYSKNQRSLKSAEYRWLLHGTPGTRAWEATHFVPVFIRRKKESAEGSYYFAGKATSIGNLRETTHSSQGKPSKVKVVVSTLKLQSPVDPELFRHLTGESPL